MAEKTILDVCCDSKMFWFDRDDDRVIFCDKRAERHTLNDKTAKGGQRDLVIAPNVISDFTALPFPSNYFQLVVFDPPHYKSIGISHGFGQSMVASKVNGGSCCAMVLQNVSAFLQKAAR